MAGEKLCALIEDADKQGSSPHPSVGTTCVGTVLKPHKTIPSPHLQYCSGAPSMPFTHVMPFCWVTRTRRPLEIFCSTQRLSSAKHPQSKAPRRWLQPEPSTVVSWVIIPCPQSPGWRKLGMDAVGQREQNLWGSFLRCMSSKPFTRIAHLGLRTELGASSGLPVSRTQTLQMMQTHLQQQFVARETARFLLCCKKIPLSPHYLFQCV